MPYGVLIVDDEPHILSTLKRILSEYFTVYEASTGDRALEMIEEEGPFAAIISDYRMPGMNGIEFFTIVQTRSPESVRIMLTGYANVDMAIEAINRAGIFYFLSKPFNTEELLHITAIAVEKYRKEVKIPTESGEEDRGSLPEDRSVQEERREYVAGLLLLNQGLVFWSEKDYVSAIEITERALNLFSENHYSIEEARSNFYLASLLLEGRGRKGIKATDNEILSFITEGVEALKKSDIRVFAQLEREVLFSLLEWTTDLNFLSTPLYSLQRELGRDDLPHPLAVYTLGSFRVLRFGKEIPSTSWRNPKVLELFFYLLAHRYKKVEKEVLFEIFWPGMDREKVANNFSTLLYYLRKGLQPKLKKPSHSTVVRFEGGHCWLDIGEDSLWIDADVFLKKINKAQSLARENKQRAILTYRDALALYQGDFLTDFLYHDWLLQERDFLRGKWQQTISHQTTLLEEEGLYEEASTLLLRALLLEPCQEEFYQHLISILIVMGKRSEALKQFQRCSKVLKEELDIEPSAKTRELIKGIYQ